LDGKNGAEIRRTNSAEAAAVGRQVQSDEATSFAANVPPLIESLRPSGVILLSIAGVTPVE